MLLHSICPAQSWPLEPQDVHCAGGEVEMVFGEDGFLKVTWWAGGGDKGRGDWKTNYTTQVRQESRTDCTGPGKLDRSPWACFSLSVSGTGRQASLLLTWWMNKAHKRVICVLHNSQPSTRLVSPGPAEYDSSPSIYRASGRPLKIQVPLTHPGTGPKAPTTTKSSKQCNRMLFQLFLSHEAWTHNCRLRKRFFWFL